VHVDRLTPSKATLLSELIYLVDPKLLPAAKTAEDRVFYENSRRTIPVISANGSPNPEAEKVERVQKARQCYENALEIAKMKSLQIIHLHSD
jgi:hypothetical protein